MAEKSNKTISFCSSSFFEYDRRMQRICKTLAREGYQITWISRAKGSASENQIPSIRNKVFKTLFRKGPLFYLEINLRIFILLIFDQQDIISVVDIDTLLAGRWASLLKKKPLVFDAHEIFYEVPELRSKPLKKKIWKAIARSIIPKLKYSYTVNHSLKKHYEEKYLSRFKIVRNVPQSRNYNSNTNKKLSNKKLLYVGALNEGRGIELAIECMDELKDYKLVLVGEGDLSHELRKLASASASSHRIIFAGFVKPEGLAAYHEEATLGINILVSDSENYRLSLANKYFDYIHSATPSINMNYPEYKFINHQYKTSYLLNDLNHKAFIEAVRYFEDTGRYQRAQNACKKATLEYNWEKESLTLLNIYKQISL